MYKFNFGKSLKIAQEINCIKSVDLAERFDVRKQHISRWRHMEDAPLSLVCKVSNELGISPIEFLRLGVDNADL
jgi:transcriptional regulator with XRE-family HTH domain